MHKPASIMAVAVACFAMHGIAFADSQLAEDATRCAPLEVPVALGDPGDVRAAVTPVPVAEPAAVAATPARPEGSGEQDRTRVISYIILRELQSAGPFLGLR